MVDVDAIEQRHIPCDEGADYCNWCNARWPCDAALLVTELRSTSGMLKLARAALKMVNAEFAAAVQDG